MEKGNLWMFLNAGMQRNVSYPRSCSVWLLESMDYIRFPRHLTG